MHRCSVLIILICAGFVGSGSASGAERGMQSLVFGADFERSVARWQLVGAASVGEEAGNRFLVTSGFSAAVVEVTPVQDFTLELRYRHANGVADLLLCRGTGSDAQDLYHVLLRNTGVALTRRARGGKAVSSEAAVELRPGAWRTLRLRRTGGQIEIQLDGKAVAALSDPQPLPVQVFSFGSLDGAGFGFDDIRLTAAGPAGVAAAALRPGEMIYGTTDAEALRGWKLGAGSRFSPRGREHQLEAAGAPEALWTRATAAHYTLSFSFLPGRGTGLVALQRSGEPARQQEYRLYLSASRVAIARRAEGQERELGSMAVRLAPDEWHDVSVFAAGDWLRLTVDHRRSLDVADAQPLPAGPMAFGTQAEEAPARYAEVRLKAWSPAQAAELRKLIQADDARGFHGPRRGGPGHATPVPKTQFVPLKVATAVIPDNWEEEAHSTLKLGHSIDPGNIPPNFVHTWVLDLKDLDTFQLHFDTVKLHVGDCIKVYNVAALKQGIKTPPPVPLATIRTTSKAEDLTVDLSKAKADVTKDGQSYKRIFVQLETSPAYTPRRLVVSKLLNTGQNKGTEEALVLADELDYAYDVDPAGQATPTFTSSIIAMGKTDAGQTVSVTAPWRLTSEAPHGFPRPDPSRGWYLLGQNLAGSSLFHSVAYYNEQLGLLRLYLRNMGMPTNVSGHTVRLCLMFPSTKKHYPGQPDSLKKFTDGEPFEDWFELKGAFFPLHPNATRWSTVEVLLADWEHRAWACIEVALLYPMAEYVPGMTGGGAQPASWYHSIYEEPLHETKDTYRSIALGVSVRSYDLGQLNATLTGKAIGHAVETLDISTGGSGKGFLDQAKAIGTAGQGIAKGAVEAAKAISSYLDDVKKNDPKADGLDKLGKFMSLGSSVFSGGFAIATAAYNFFNWFVGGNQRQPLQLAVELDLQGVVQGSVKVQHQRASSWYVYLPGRFSIVEATQMGLEVGDPKAVARVAPRYDRPLGLFGYRYSPREVRFTLLAQRWTPYYTLPDFKTPFCDLVTPVIYPADPNLAYDPDFPPGMPQDLLDSMRSHHKSWEFTERAKLQAPLARIGQLPPIIYNPYAEITPVPPVPVKKEGRTIEVKGPASKEMRLKPADDGTTQVVWHSTEGYLDTEFDWYYDLSWKTHVTPEKDDAAFPQGVDPPVKEYGPRLSVIVYHNGAGETCSSLGSGTLCFTYQKLPTGVEGGPLVVNDGRLIEVIPKPAYVPTTLTAFKELKGIDLTRSYRGNAGWPAADPFVPGAGIYPVDSVVLSWDIPYFYYGRTRPTKRQDGSVTYPRFRGMQSLTAPLGLDVLSVELDKDGWPKKGPARHDPALSTLLLPVAE